MPDTVVNDSYGYGGDIEKKLRAKVAQALILQGSSATPVQHWTQGLARVAQALSGGYMGGQLGADEARDEANAAAERTIPGQPVPGAVMPAPSMGPRSRTMSALVDEGPTAPAAPTPYTLNPGMTPRDSQDTFRTPLDASRPSPDAIRTAAAAAGQPPMSPPMANPTLAGAVPVQTQSFTPPPQMAQAASIQQGTPAVPGPQTVAPSNVDLGYINTLMHSRNKENRQLGMHLYQKYQDRSKEQVTQRTDPNTGATYQERGTGERIADPSRAEYNIHYLPDGTAIAVNKNNPRDTRVVDPQQAQKIIDFEANKEGAKETAQGRAKIAVTKEAQKEGKQKSAAIVLDTIATAKNQIDNGYFTTGLTGSVASLIPGTSAHDLSNTLDTIKANIGFDKLNEMRAASPTGGALGSVSDFENRLLQSTLGSVRQSQGADQLKKNLTKLEQLYNQVIHEGIETPKGWTKDKPVTPDMAPAPAPAPIAPSALRAPLQQSTAPVPANRAFDREGAKAAGWTDAEIDAFLRRQR